MKISLSWLKNYVKIDHSVAEMARIITEHAFETTVVNDRPEVDLSNVYTGDVLEVERHPNADRLSVAKVKVGTKIHSIVCGAPNLRVGLKVAVVFPGAQVISKEGQLVTLEKAVIRGVPSEGMMCSERELGLGDSHGGIIELSKDAKNNWTLDKIFTKNVVLEVDVLPDRASDSSCYYGLAREIGALLDSKTSLPKISLKINRKGNGPSVEVENNKHCLRYVATVLEGINNGPSPDWIQENLRSQGIKPQNLIVDATNYVLWELGQPTHAFDADTLGKSIVVRQTKKTEKITTLDGVERELPEGTLVIASNEAPVAIAGVMGGLATAVKSETTKVVLESAFFTAPVIRQFVNKTNLRTDASDRFIRGLTLGQVAAGTNRVIEILVKHGGGKVTAQGEYLTKVEKVKPVLVEHQQIEDCLGTKVKPSLVVKILKKLDCGVKTKGKTYSVTAPIFRRDINIPEDVIEEVARFIGYNNLPAKLPDAPIVPALLPGKLKDVRRVQDLFKAAGWSEAYLYSVVSDRVLKAVDPENKEKRHKLVNPLRSDENSLRTSLIPNLIGVAESAVKKEPITRIFEVSHVYPVAFDEHTRFAGAIVRRGEFNKADFYETKGLIEYVLQEMGIDRISFKKNDSFLFDSGVSATIFASAVKVGEIGLVSPSVTNALNIRGSLVVFEINFDALEKIERVEKVYNPPFPFPTIQRDVTFVLPSGVLVDAVQENIAMLGGNTVQDVDFVDQYENDGVRSVTLRVVYGSREKTLTDSEVNSLQKKILSALSEKLGVKER